MRQQTAGIDIASRRDVESGSAAGRSSAKPLWPGTVDVGDQRGAILVCYEQLLTLPMLRCALESLSLLIAISNEAWTAATIVPRVQHTCVRAWARLFALPVTSAINS